MMDAWSVDNLWSVYLSHYFRHGISKEWHFTRKKNGGLVLQYSFANFETVVLPHGALGSLG